MVLQTRQIRALLFDVDGTLRDTDDHYTARLEKRLSPIRKLLPHQDARKTARRIVMTLDTPINAGYAWLDWLWLDGITIGMLDKLQGLHLRKAKTDLPLIPGVIESLEAFADSYPMAVVSARGERGTQEFLEGHGIIKYFKCVVTGQSTRHTKPWPDPVLWAADQLGVTAKDCLMIGDTTVDIRSGRAAGAQTVGVLSGFGDELELRRVKADMILNSVADLPGVLLET